jgi:hypothetical protein
MRRHRRRYRHLSPGTVGEVTAAVITSWSTPRHPRRPLSAAEHDLGDRFTALGEPSGDDLASLLHMLDGLVAKNRLKTLADGIS